jgi:hypothetical protein
VVDELGHDHEPRRGRQTQRLRHGHSEDGETGLELAGADLDTGPGPSCSPCDIVLFIFFGSLWYYVRWDWC